MFEALTLFELVVHYMKKKNLELRKLVQYSSEYLILQAILPLRGKILNIERRDEAAMYKNEEIQNLILGLGLGVKVKIFLFH